MARLLFDDDFGAGVFVCRGHRTRRADAVPHEFAAGLIEVWRRFRIQDMTLAVLKTALRLRERHGFSFWDSAIIAAAPTLGCDRVYTEDMSHGQVVEGVAIADPFR